MIGEGAKDSSGVVVAGAGQAGFSVASKLREHGFAGPIILVGKEDHPPYQRPPLSKAYLTGEMSRDRLYLRSASFYAQNRIDLRLGTCVTVINRDRSLVGLSDGGHLPYGWLVLATGTRPRRLPETLSQGLAGIYYMRSLADIDAMATEFRPGRHLLVLGGGYIGLEVAAVAAKSGLKVTLIEMSERILQRVAAPETSGFFRNLHVENGVTIREGVGLEQLLGHERVSTARLSDGSDILIDFVIVGIGVVPNDELATAAGLEVNNGILVDEHCKTSDPRILAVGDCASFPFNGQRLRLESVGNAIDQADAAAKTILGKSTGYRASPWFWSDQYAVKLQIVGLSAGHHRVAKRMGEKGSMSLWYYRNNDLIAVDAINDPKAYMIAKRLIQGGNSPAFELIGDPSTDLKSLIP